MTLFHLLFHNELNNFFYCLFLAWNDRGVNCEMILALMTHSAFVPLQ